MGVVSALNSGLPGTCGIWKHLHAAGRACLLNTESNKLLGNPRNVAFKSKLKYHSVCGMLRRNEKRFDEILTASNEEGCYNLQSPHWSADVQTPASIVGT